jgi:hypothetical protein
MEVASSPAVGGDRPTTGEPQANAACGRPLNRRLFCFFAC